MVEFHSFLLHGRVSLISEHTPKHTASRCLSASPAAAREWGEEDGSQEAYLYVLSTKIRLLLLLSKQHTREPGLSDEEAADGGREHVSEIKSEASPLKMSSRMYPSAQPS